MTVLESIVVSIFCLALVFAVMACIALLIKLVSKIIQALEHDIVHEQVLDNNNADNIVESPKNMEPIGMSGELKLVDVDEKTAAIIMAIVSHESNIPLSELSFKSIKVIE